MTKIMLDKTIVSLWRNLITDSQAICQIELEHNIEAYLTFMLIRYTSNKNFSDFILGKNLLESVSASHSDSISTLQLVGDHALLFSGLFPKRAENRHVDLSYFIKVGRSAYGALAAKSSRDQATFLNLANQFHQLVDVLNAMRSKNENTFFDWLDLWQQTESKRAELCLKQHYTGNIVLNRNISQTKH